MFERREDFLALEVRAVRDLVGCAVEEKRWV